MDHASKFQDDMLRLLKLEPFWGTVAVSLKHEFDTKLNATAAVGIDGRGITFYCNPALYFRMPIAHRLADIIHELFHIVDRHFARRNAIVDSNCVLPIFTQEDYDMIKAIHKACLYEQVNYAADMSINTLIKNISDDSVFPSSYNFPDGLSMEQYVAMLLRRAANQRQGKQQCQNGTSKGNGNSQQGQGNDQAQQGQGNAQHNAAGKGNGQGNDKGNSGNNGQGGNGKGNGNGQHHDCPMCGVPMHGNLKGDHSRWDGSKGDITQADLQTAEALVVSIIENCNNRGLIPGHMKARFDDIINPRMNISTVLNNFIASSVSTETRRSWTRVNRRLPYEIKGRIRQDRLKLIVVADTSGSIGDDFLRLFWGILRAFQEHGAEIFVIECDSKFQDAYEFTEDRVPEFNGRGGTAFEPAFRYISENALEADGIIYLTDGYGDNPAPYPGAKTLWLVTPGGRQPAPWGQTIHMPDYVMA